MNRREFTRLGAAASLMTLPAFRALAENFDYPWKLGIITDEVDFDLHKVLSTFYPKYQLKWAEIRDLKLDGANKYVYQQATAAELRETKQQLDGAGVKLSVLDTAVYKIALPGTKPLGMSEADLNPSEGQYGRQIDDLKRAADAAHTLGTSHVRIFAYRRVADPSAVFDRVVDELRKAITVAKQQDVTLLLENEFSCNVATGEETARIFNTINDSTLMLNWDPGNCYEAGEEPFPKAWDQIDHSRIGHIHLKDASGKAWMPIGAGKIDFHGQFEALKKMGYSGTMSLETHYRNAAHDRYTSSVESMNGLMKVLQQV